MDRPRTYKFKRIAVVSGALALAASVGAYAGFEHTGEAERSGQREVKVAHPMAHSDESPVAKSAVTPAAEEVHPAAHAESHVDAHAEVKHTETKAAETKAAETKHSEPKKAESHAAELPAKTGPGLFQQITHKATFWFTDLTEKMAQIRQAEDENIHLKQENASLRLALETRAFEVHAKSASERTQDYANRLERDTWALVGRTVAGIHYEIPQSLQPAQIFTLGLDYFNAGEDEKAAKIFTFLAGLEEGEYNSPEHMLLNGVVWFRLDNLRIADAYFEKAIGSTASNDHQKAQARIWRALVAERKGDHSVAQTHLKELLAHHPKAPEVKLVNPLKAAQEEAAAEKAAEKERDREPASGHEE